MPNLTHIPNTNIEIDEQYFLFAYTNNNELIQLTEYKGFKSLSEALVEAEKLYKFKNQFTLKRICILKLISAT